MDSFFKKLLITRKLTQVVDIIKCGSLHNSILSDANKNKALILLGFYRSVDNLK